MSEWTKKIPKTEIKSESEETLKTYIMNNYKETLKTAITSHITADTVTFADKFGNYLTAGTKITTSQLRRFYGEVKRIQMQGYEEHKSDFILLKPKLAYAVGRAGKGNKIKVFYEVIADMIDNVKDENSFKNFIKIFEAIVAYHRKYEKEREEK